MALKKSSSSMAELLERVLHKGIVIDGWARVSVAGIDLVGVEGRVVVASLATYAKRSKTIDRALGRKAHDARTMRHPPLISKSGMPSEEPAPANMAVESRPGLCPVCRKEGRRQELVLVTVQTSGETRATARCSVCGWQRTYAE